MGTPLLQHDDGQDYHMPSTFSPWQQQEESARQASQGSIGTQHTADSSHISLWTAYPSSPDSAEQTPTMASPQRAGIISPISFAMEEDVPTPRAFNERQQTGMSTESSIGWVNSPAMTSNEMRSDVSTETRSPDLSITSGAQGPSVMGNVNAMRSAEVMPTHPAADSIPMTAVYSPPTEADSGGEEDVDTFSLRYSRLPLDCYSRRDVHIKRLSWLYFALLSLAIYSTVLSGVWLIAAIIQPSYGRRVSSGQGARISPSTATLLATLLAKTIELSFVTVFCAVLGQVLTRRAFSRNSKGVTIAEMTMRNWVVQPGSLITHWEGLPYAATTVLGALTLSASICVLFYTTASDAMVSPKLAVLPWKTRVLQGTVNASYANPFYVADTCQTPLRSLDVNAPTACEDVSFSGQSYHSFIAFMTEWQTINDAGNKTNSSMGVLSGRPTGTASLNDNTTIGTTWIETQYGDVAANSKSFNRIINNVTLAIPHPGVYSVATDRVNGILQPDELSGVGQYSVRAGVVSPVVNVLCVNMNATELAPLVYTTWNHANTTTTDIPGQEIANGDWEAELPHDWINKTVVDDIFLWSNESHRLPPAFPLYPADFNMVTYSSENYTDSLYVLAKRPNITDYTLCQLRSWVTAKCSTEFDMSGTSGGYLTAHCEDSDDPNQYQRVDPEDAAKTQDPSGDWKELATEWGLSINLNGGTENNNASNARILTELILAEAELNPLLPSVAEAIAVLATSTLVAGSTGSTFKATWEHGGTDEMLDPGAVESIHTQVQTQQYASAHTQSWQAIFYIVLGLVFLLDVLCLVYLIFGTSIASFAHGYSSASLNPSKLPRSSKSPFSSFLPSFSRKQTQSNTNNKKASIPPPDSDSEEYDNDINPDDVNQNSRGGGVLGTSTNIMRRRGGGGGGGGRANTGVDGLVTDYTEPQNLFALAINSPPSAAMAGSCGHGPDKNELVVPFKVGYAPGANHYFFKEGGPPSNNNNMNKTNKKESQRLSNASGVELLGVGGSAANANTNRNLRVYGGGGGGKNHKNNKTYKRLSSHHSWL
ncbi:hypothetical protein F5Y16DRAFT_378895 [Xylariaceae sp. FL0255]|nr:hypothetical protein F5Y16DRAFT_378895 [Xylariaceae sp. FL0255]